MSKGSARRARTAGKSAAPQQAEPEPASPEEPEHRTDPEVIAKAIGEVEADQLRHDDSGPINEWTLTNGVHLRMKRIPPSLLADIGARVPQPKPPEFVADETSGRMDTNPDDPDYKQALQDWAQDRSEAAFAAAAVFGCEIISLPEGMMRPEDDGWIEEIERVWDVLPDEERIEIARQPVGKRFYHWLRYYAIDDDADLFAVSRILTARTVLTENEVTEMVARFRYMAVGFPDYIGRVAGWSGADADSIPTFDPGDHFGI